MIGQAELDKIAARADGTLRLARSTFADDPDATEAQTTSLLAIAEQLALANALAMVRLAREAGER